MVDAAGAIYVIGGDYDGKYHADVWVSTDGGADRTRAGFGRGVLEGYPTGTNWGTRGYLGGTRGIK